MNQQSRGGFSADKTDLDLKIQVEQNKKALKCMEIKEEIKITRQE